MAFKARKLSKGLFEVMGLEAFIEQRVTALLEAKQPGRSPARAKTAKRGRATARSQTAPKPQSTLQQLVAALDAHPKKAQLVRAGKQQKDQLLRSLIPLYLTKKLSVDVSSGATSDFWKRCGVKYLAPNAAKALREHVGYARLTKTGRQITPHGVKYVDSALVAARSAA